jgi:hypothetical protein
MANMTIVEAAEHLGISKEAIHNRVRRGSLEVTIVDGVKLVNIDKTLKSRVQNKRSITQISEDRYYKLLEEQNTKLQARVEKLENETTKLRDQKEQMLIDERIKIEQIYKDKDEQLKNIIGTISSEFMLNAPRLAKDEEHLDAEIEEIEVSTPKADLISLKKYLKSKNLTNKKRVKIKKRIKKIAKKDNRIIILGGKYYLDIIKYDYSDFFRK